jgi:hypothetical protein
MPNAELPTHPRLTCGDKANRFLRLFRKPVDQLKRRSALGAAQPPSELIESEPIEIFGSQLGGRIRVMRHRGQWQETCV